MAVVYLGLGGNLGDRAGTLRAARQRLQAGGVTIEACSSLYETEPWGLLEQPRFLNAVCQGQTDLDPLVLLALIKRIETALGRQATVRYGPRTADIDILLYDELMMAGADLVVPHPGLRQRAFVLVPLAEIAPDLRMPGDGRTARELLEALLDVSGVRPVGGFEEA